MNHFDFIIDIACAHSYLGWHRLAGALARRRSAGRATTIRFQPAQIRPDAPHDPEPLRAVHERVLGPQANDDADALARRASPEGLEYRFDRAQFVNTFDAHLLIALAHRQGRQEAAATALFEAYFRDGLVLTDPETLRGIGSRLGVTYDPTGEQRERLAGALLRTRRRGVDALPTLASVDGRRWSGARPASEYDDIINST